MSVWVCTCAHVYMCVSSRFLDSFRGVNDDNDFPKKSVKRIMSNFRVDVITCKVHSPSTKRITYRIGIRSIRSITKQLSQEKRKGVPPFKENHLIQSWFFFVLFSHTRTYTHISSFPSASFSFFNIFFWKVFFTIRKKYIYFWYEFIRDCSSSILWILTIISKADEERDKFRRIRRESVFLRFLFFFFFKIDSVYACARFTNNTGAIFWIDLSKGRALELLSVRHVRVRWLCVLHFRSFSA